MHKVCNECGIEKPLNKFYRHPWEPDGFMPRCKFCHNGGQELIRRQTDFFAERQLGDPSEEQITAACLKLQSRWSDKKRASRRARRSMS